MCRCLAQLRRRQPLSDVTHLTLDLESYKREQLSRSKDRFAGLRSTGHRGIELPKTTRMTRQMESTRTRFSRLGVCAAERISRDFGGSATPPRALIVVPGASSQADHSCHFLPRTLLAGLGGFLSNLQTTILGKLLRAGLDTFHAPSLLSATAAGLSYPAAPVRLGPARWGLPPRSAT